MLLQCETFLVPEGVAQASAYGSFLALAHYKGITVYDMSAWASSVNFHQQPMAFSKILKHHVTCCLLQETHVWVGLVSGAIQAWDWHARRCISVVARKGFMPVHVHEIKDLIRVFWNDRTFTTYSMLNNVIVSRSEQSTWVRQINIHDYTMAFHSTRLHVWPRRRIEVQLDHFKIMAATIMYFDEHCHLYIAVQNPRPTTRTIVSHFKLQDDLMLGSTMLKEECMQAIIIKSADVDMINFRDMIALAIDGAIELRCRKTLNRIYRMRLLVNRAFLSVVNAGGTHETLIATMGGYHVQAILPSWVKCLPAVKTTLLACQRKGWHFPSELASCHMLAFL